MNDKHDDLNTPANAASDPAPEDLDRRRREALEKLAAFTAYTPPVLLTLLLSTRDSAASPGLPPPPPGGFP
jgi:hypothetical protein